MQKNILLKLKKNISNLLSQAYPFYYQGKELWLITVSLFFMTLLFGYFFEPFEVYQPEHKIGYFWITLIHSCTPVFIVFLFLSLKMFPRVKDNWNIKKEILLIAIFLLIVGIAQFLIRDVIYDNPNNWSLQYFYEEIRNTSLVGILFAFILVPINYHRLNTRNSTNANAFNTSKEITINSNRTPSYINELDVDSQNVLYAKAEGNYVELFLRNGSKTLKRLTMKRLENILDSYPNYIRTHRSYIVNINQIDSVTGNAQGYKLQIKNCANIIPVSRNMISMFDEKMNSH
ncbi:LytR/AlgR family response regulator transcription factor [Psychroflexus sp. MES1-P1E]|uniref:LytR/AlgR family response regulator transcription factor n=1 Tax=Psychroflexus sp. MES1-P1E TaxID=2058320 RepID=UPI000C7AC51F|nr:LytTR family DNA-binding domain-containing protein [Psychroflexus sp. MES1-P1E]PKG42763.1 LytTR family transcriptional regulator [Psychroflexus sp. MES1-P1E]